MFLAICTCLLDHNLFQEKYYVVIILPISCVLKLISLHPVLTVHSSVWNRSCQRIFGLSTRSSEDYLAWCFAFVLGVSQKETSEWVVSLNVVRVCDKAVKYEAIWGICQLPSMCVVCLKTGYQLHQHFPNHTLLLSAERSRGVLPWLRGQAWVIVGFVAPLAVALEMYDVGEALPRSG